MKRKHLVIGASGQVGRQLVRTLEQNQEQVEGTYASRMVPGYHPLDITQAQAVRDLVRQLTPQVVWLPAALPDVDRCEREPEMSWRVNVQGTQNVAHAVREIGAQLVFFSTDYVFDGIRGPFKEDDAVHPIQVYGKHKVEAESYILYHVPKALIIRPAWVYSREDNPRNFIWRIIQQIERRDPIKAAVDQISTPTNAERLAKVAMEAVTAQHSGILHVVGPDRLSRFELTERIAHSKGYHDVVIEPITTGSLGLPAARPLNGGLVTQFPPFRIYEGLSADLN